jgi:hypothetical protein
LSAGRSQPAMQTAIAAAARTRGSLLPSPNAAVDN